MLMLEGLLYLSHAKRFPPIYDAVRAICLALVGNATMVAWEKSSTMSLFFYFYLRTNKKNRVLGLILFTLGLLMLRTRIHRRFATILFLRKRQEA